MDTTFFLTTEAAQNSTPKSDNSFARDGKSQNFDLFFKSFLQQGLMTQEGTTIMTSPIKENNKLNLELDNAISSLESLLSGEISTADIYKLEDFADMPIGQIITSLQGDNIALPDATKIALLDRLLGTPTQHVEIDTLSNQDASPFANTEATLNGDDLFERILQNLNSRSGDKYFS